MNGLSENTPKERHDSPLTGELKPCCFRLATALPVRHEVTIQVYLPAISGLFHS